MTKRLAESFADAVARIKARPAEPVRAPQGRHGDYWGDPRGHRYEQVAADLAPDDAVELARHGALIVYDQCGCGGDLCRLDWLSAEDVARIARSGTPVLDAGKSGRAELEHWRSSDGRDLIVAAVGVSWGDRIQG